MKIEYSNRQAQITAGAASSDAAQPSPALFPGKKSSLRLTSPAVDLESLMAMLSTAQEDKKIESAKNRIECIQTLIKSLSRECRDASSGNMELLRVAEQYADMLADTDARLDECNAELTELKKNHYSLSAQKNDLEQSVCTLQKQMDELQTAFDSRSKELQELKEQSAVSPDEKVELERKIKETEAGLAETGEKIARLEEYLNRALDTLESENAALTSSQAQIEKTMAVISETKKLRIEIENKLDAALGEIFDDAGLKTQIENLLSEVNHTTLNDALINDDRKDRDEKSGELSSVAEILLKAEEKNRNQLLESIESKRLKTI